MKRTLHLQIKNAVLKAIEEAYDHAAETNETWAAKKPAFMKHVDVKVDEALRPIFT